ncbi:glycoside hydrolase family 3 N-terminal domain-containing protein [Ancylomarina sp.]|uniref:glycoside hydrolase family 3 N-terminal domain-containing protein n=1 Tax=Ancylomarina sp. TaxID=1970196 RepID=UPI003569F745
MILKIPNLKRIVLVTFCFMSLSSIAQSDFVSSQPLSSIYETDAAWADSIMSGMNQEQRIAQLFMVAAYSNKTSSEEKMILNLIENYQIGGLIFFQGTPQEQARLTNLYQSKSTLPLWIGMDAEYGLGARLKQTLKYPQQITMGAVQDTSLLFMLGKEMAVECRRMGIHVNFAPVLDINSNPKNPVINSRSYGEGKVNVAEKGIAFSRGMQSGGVVAVGKHFPGHGDTDTDSHHDLPVVDRSREELDELELHPFRESIEAGIGGIMVAHLNVPALDKVAKAATLSRPIVTDLLKNELGFKGLVFTDALNMQGVRKFYKPGEVDAKAAIAGNDVLLFSEDVPKAINEIKAAIASGDLLQEDINQSCLKILKTKYWLGLNQYKPVSSDRLWSGLNTQQGLILRSMLVENAMTVVSNKNDLLPLQRLDTLRIASVAMGAKKRNHFQEYLGRYTDIDFYQIDKNASQKQYNTLLKNLDSYNLIIVSKHDSNLRASKKFGVTDETVSFVSNLSKRKKVIFDLFASPYALDFYKKLERQEATLVSYEDNEETQKASAQIIFGGIGAKGRLPVSVNKDIPEGTGLDTKKNRLGYALPGQTGFDSSQLKKVDSIVYDAIEQKATPGCQILVAHKGRIIYDKAYGYHTYAKNVNVKQNDLYDLASVTKVAASLPILMQLVDEGEIDIDGQLGDYLTVAKGTNKDTLVLRKILAHEARLLPWKPFHREAVDTARLRRDLFSHDSSRVYRVKVGNHLFANKNYRFRKSLFKTMASKEYPIQIAKNMYLKEGFSDSIYKRILATDYREANGYKYSDLGFILLKKMFEEHLTSSMESYVKTNLYRKLGAGTLGYHPRQRFSLSRIIPTQNDHFFRKQLIKGYVQDPTAAMLGGVAGHAGVFGNAADVAKLMQMYLQKGSYGGVTFFQPETLEQFTSRAYPDGENRRGIGFDKPFLDPTNTNGPTTTKASPNSFGHSGFTGTMVWVDPDYDLVYIFLSNRVFPDDWNTKLMQMDVRTKIQECLYDAINPPVIIDTTENIIDILP